MALNLASAEVGVTISSSTSACPGCPASNTLVDAAERVWLSEPLSSSDNEEDDDNTSTYQPQSLTLDFSQLSTAQPSVTMHTAGVYLWHSYSSNPKVISIFSSKDGASYSLVGKYAGKGKPSDGLILFELDTPVHLRQTRFVRFDFEETYGGNQVYVNRLHLYESTPDVVKLFVDDFVEGGSGGGGGGVSSGGGSRSGRTDLAGVSTPATNEATSVVGVRIDDSLAKLQESLVYQYSSGLDESLDDLMHDRQHENDEQQQDDNGFGVHLHRSGSMDIHIPSTAVGGSSINGGRPTTHVRIHGGGSSSPSVERRSSLLSPSSSSSSSSSSTTTRTTRHMDQRGGNHLSSESASLPLVQPHLSTWAIDLAVRTPLSDQLSAMCEQVAELADKKGIQNHNLRSFNSDDNHRLLATGGATKTVETVETVETAETAENAKTADEPAPTGVLQDLQISLRDCAVQASSLELRVQNVEIEMNSLKDMMRKVLERTGGDITGGMRERGRDDDGTTATTPPLPPPPPPPSEGISVLETKRVVVDALKRWEKDMVTSVFEPSVRNAIRKFETRFEGKMSKELASLREGNGNSRYSGREKKSSVLIYERDRGAQRARYQTNVAETHKGNQSNQAAAENEYLRSWAVGATINVENAMKSSNKRMLPASPEMVQLKLVTRLQEKMEEKAKKLRAIESLHRSTATMSVGIMCGGGAEFEGTNGHVRLDDDDDDEEEESTKGSMHSGSGGHNKNVIATVRLPYVTKEEEDEGDLDQKELAVPPTHTS